MLRITDLQAGYGGVSITHTADLMLDAGRSCLLRGQSGSGKTTLLHTIAGIQSPLTGSIKIKGTEITTLSEPERDRFRGTHIGLVFQTLHLVKSLSVLENVLLGSFVNDRPQNSEKALSLLASAGLSGMHDKPITTLSQGQAQRVAIVRALLSEPALLLADEPTSSLDDASCAQIMSLLLAGCATTGAALIVSSHDARIISHFDQVITLPDRSQA